MYLEKFLKRTYKYAIHFSQENVKNIYFIIEVDKNTAEEKFYKKFPKATIEKTVEFTGTVSNYRKNNKQ